MNFFYIAIVLTVGLGFYFAALNLIHYRNLSNVVMIIFGGLTPAVLAMRVKFWMLYQCRQSQFLYDRNVSKQSFIWDIGMFVLALVGFALIISNFSQMYTLSSSQKGNVLAVCFCLISGVCIGLGLAEIRILCRFKEIRTTERKQNYYFLKPLFWTLLTSQVIVPAFMYPSLASQG